MLLAWLTLLVVEMIGGVGVVKGEVVIVTMKNKRVSYVIVSAILNAGGAVVGEYPKEFVVVVLALVNMDVKLGLLDRGKESKAVTTVKGQRFKGG